MQEYLDLADTKKGLWDHAAVVFDTYIFSVNGGNSDGKIKEL